MPENVAKKSEPEKGLMIIQKKLATLISLILNFLKNIRENLVQTNQIFKRLIPSHGQNRK